MLTQLSNKILELNELIRAVDMSNQSDLFSSFPFLFLFFIFSLLWSWEEKHCLEQLKSGHKGLHIKTSGRRDPMIQAINSNFYIPQKLGEAIKIKHFLLTFYLSSKFTPPVFLFHIK